MDGQCIALPRPPLRLPKHGRCLLHRLVGAALLLLQVACHIRKVLSAACQHTRGGCALGLGRLAERRVVRLRHRERRVLQPLLRRREPLKVLSI